jgi:hypothetical protein
MENLEWFYIIPDQSKDEWLKILVHTDGLIKEVKKAFFTLDLLKSKKAPESIKHLIKDGFFDQEQQVRLDLIKKMQEEKPQTVFEPIELIDIIEIPSIGFVTVEAYTMQDCLSQ